MFKPLLTSALLTLAAVVSAPASAQMTKPHTVPDAFLSRMYTVEVDGTPVQVFEASPRVHFASFDFTGEVEVKAVGKVYREKGVPLPIRDEQQNGDPIWDGEAVVRPLSDGVEVKTDGELATFRLTAPGQYAVEGRKVSQDATDNHDIVLFLFANPPEPEADRPNQDDPNVIFLEAGLHQENIDLTDGQTLYLDAGAVLFGSVDAWDAENVKILGRGVVYHRGPHSENNDDGYLHRKDWHPLTTHNVRGMTVEGVTFVGRSRTWTIQMHSTYDASFDNVKLLAVNDQNINGDGFDWKDSGGRTTIRNSLVRSADDCFAIFTDRGPTPTGIVEDILIENCVLWPTRANIWRFSGYAKNVTLRDSDVLHVPESLYSTPRAILCSVRANEEQVLEVSDVLFEDLRLEEPAALLGIEWSKGVYRGITFRNITMPAEPEPSRVAAASISDVLIENVRFGDELVDERDELDFSKLPREIENLRFAP